jgi:hypothetical protein
MTFSDSDLLEDVLKIVFDESDHDITLWCEVAADDMLRCQTSMQRQCQASIHAGLQPIGGAGHVTRLRQTLKPYQWRGACNSQRKRAEIAHIPSKDGFNLERQSMAVGVAPSGPQWGAP